MGGSHSADRGKPRPVSLVPCAGFSAHKPRLRVARVTVHRALWGQGGFRASKGAEDMAATAFQQQLCRLIATSRRRSGESYVAGGVALNTLLQAPGSRVILICFTTRTRPSASPGNAIGAADPGKTWGADRTAGPRLCRSRRVERRGAGHRTVVARERIPVLSVARRERFGVVLHPFDLATNKILALAGRIWNPATGSTS